MNETFSYNYATPPRLVKRFAACKLKHQENEMTAHPGRRLGRPDQQASEELVRHIVETATRLFIEHGYPATSIEQIAAAAGSGKQTIYRRFTSKEGLFTAVINQRARRLLEAAGAAACASGADPTARLKAACREYFDFRLQPDAIRLHRILAAEGVRFPKLNESILECSQPFHTLLNRLLAEAMDAGKLRKADPELTRYLLASLLAGQAAHHATIGIEPFRSAEARDVYFEEAWDLFIRGMR
jgi:AcrR family transcriptional regulator